MSASAFAGDGRGRARFKRALALQTNDRPPAWFMRQAGRYLPEYRALKEQHGFLGLVRTPELAAEVTYQPLRRFPFDAAILFSDILVIPEALGHPYRFGDQGGIRMERCIESAADIEALDPKRVCEHLHYVFTTLRLLRAQLGEGHALLGFCGSPWTLAAYLVEGGGSEHFPKFLAFAYREPLLLGKLLSVLTEALGLYLSEQARAGADAVQIFDSWAALCPGERYEEWSLRWMRELVTSLQGKAPVLLFARGAGSHLSALAASGAAGLSVDTSVHLARALEEHPGLAWQGNLDPTVLELEPDLAARAARTLLTSVGGRPGHILNLGHGMRPTSRIECVAAVLAEVAKPTG